MNKKYLFVVIGIVLILIIGLIVFNSRLTGFFALNTKSQDNQKIKIGVMAMMTGPFTYIGENDVRTIELTLDELGYKDKVELIIEDTGQNNNLSGTVLAYRKLVDVDKVKIIVDIMTSDGTMAVAPLLEQDKVVMMTPGTAGEQIDKASEYLFRNGPSDIKAGTAPAEDLYEKFNYRNIAIFTDNTEYTLDISKHFKDTYKGNIVLDQIILLNQNDYRTEVSKLKDKQINGVIINSQDGTTAGYIIKELKEQDYNYPIFINFFAYNVNSKRIAGEDNFEGIYVYAPEFNENDPHTIAFFEKFKQRYGSYPVVPFHSTGTYDCIKMFIEAVNAVGYDGEKIHDYLLENIQNWQGMNGVVSFDENGNTQTGFVLKQIRDGQLVSVK